MSRMNSSTCIVRRSMSAPFSFFALRTPMRLPYFHRMFRIEPDVRLCPERDFHLRDLSAVELLVDFLGDPVERVDRLVRQGRGRLWFLTHRRATPPFRRSRSRPLLLARAGLPPRPRNPSNSIPSPRAAVPRRSRGPG